MDELNARAYMDVMFALVREGGIIALDLIDSSRPELKPDSSVITLADLSISKLAAEKLAPFLNAGGHVLIDEEDPRRGEYLDEAFLEQHPFVWSLDPVDATRAYANRMPHYGISIGLIKDRQPWLGVVYFPSLKELFYCDGDSAYFVKEAFMQGEVRTKIQPFDEVLSSRSVFIASDEMLSHFEWRQQDCRVMIFASAVCEFCWPAIGRGCGSLSKVYLWDLAGSWPVFQKAGLNLYSLKTGKRLDRMDTDIFERGQTPWKFKDYYILSSERNHFLLSQRLVKKGGVE